MASSADVGEGEDVDYYELLGLTFSASITVKEIKKAYRDKAKTSHPDKNPDDPTAAERFQAISKAYELLLDEDRRAKYIQQCNAKLQKKRKEGGSCETKKDGTGRSWRLSHSCFCKGKRTTTTTESKRR